MKPVLSAAILENHVGIMGKTGSGKSNLAKVVAEQLLAAGERVCILDPTGTWYGLRLTRERKPSPYQVVIFGGVHGDFPIAAHHGAEIAAALARSTTSAIIDTRTMSVSARTTFATAFAETLLQRNVGRLYVIVDEAHLFAPQGRVPDTESGKMVHAWNNLASLGRGIGLVLIPISQRPAKLHKDTLTQVETLVAMRLIAPQDVAAIKDWIGEWAGKDAGGEVIRSLPSLPTGTGWVWSPGLDMLERREFPLTSVLDTGKPSESGEIELAPIDIDAIRAQLGRVEEERKANDPAELRRQIADLSKQLRERPASVETVIERVEVPVIDAAAVDRFAILTHELEDLRDRLVGIARDANDDLAELRTTAPRPAPVIPAATAVERPAPRSGPDRAQPEASSGTSGASPSGSLGKAERLILAALAGYPTGLTREQLAFLAGYHPRTPGFANAVGKLRSGGLVSTGWPAEITRDGHRALADADLAPMAVPPLEAWMERFGKAERLILQHVLDAHPSALERQDLADRAGYHPRTPGFANALGKLRGLGLLDGYGLHPDFARLIGR